eukprot:34345-Eustigmatos_ZCMA.PRE.1
MDTRIEPPSFHHESTVMHDSTTLHHSTDSNLHQHPSAGMHHVESRETKIKTVSLSASSDSRNFQRS